MSIAEYNISSHSHKLHTIDINLGNFRENPKLIFARNAESVSECAKRARRIEILRNERNRERSNFNRRFSKIREIPKKIKGKTTDFDNSPHSTIIEKIPYKGKIWGKSQDNKATIQIKLLEKNDKYRQKIISQVLCKRKKCTIPENIILQKPINISGRDSPIKYFKNIYLQNINLTENMRKSPIQLHSKSKQSNYANITEDLLMDKKLNDYSPKFYPNKPTKKVHINNKRHKHFPTNSSFIANEDCIGIQTLKQESLENTLPDISVKISKNMRKSPIDLTSYISNISNVPNSVKSNINRIKVTLNMMTPLKIKNIIGNKRSSYNFDNLSDNENI